MRVGRDINSAFPLRRTPMCSGSPDDNIIDSATGDEIRAVYQEAAHEVSGIVLYKKFTAGPDFTVTLNTNDFIDFKEDAGVVKTAQLAAGTYIMGLTSDTAGTLCKVIKTALESVGTVGYTVTYDPATSKVTIAKASGTIQILWLTGTNNAKGAFTLLGWSKVDTIAAITLISDGTTAGGPSQNPYDEDTSKVFAAPVTLPAIININPSVKEFSEQGMREPVDALLTFSVLDLMTANVDLSTDDHIMVNGVDYMVYQINPEAYIGNIPTTMVVVGKVYSVTAQVTTP